MINIFEGTTQMQGSLFDIESEIESGLIAVIRAIRDNVDDERALLVMSEIASLMTGYMEGMNKGLSHDECNQMAIDELNKLAKE